MTHPRTIPMTGASSEIGPGIAERAARRDGIGRARTELGIDLAPAALFRVNDACSITHPVILVNGGMV